MPTAVARLKITLNDVEPAVMRRIDVPLNIRLDRLHLAIQTAMGWTNTHLWALYARDISWSIPDPEFGDDSLDARKSHLVDVLEDTGTRTLRYLYDFGDGLDHTIKVERIGPAHPVIPYPRLVAASDRCPPKDVGGPPGYAEFLAALADPKHERHAELVEWHGEDFKPNDLDVFAIDRALDELARAGRVSEGRTQNLLTRLNE